MSHRRRLAWSLALLFAVNIAVISLAQQAQAATYRQGSTGEQVRIIQTKLKNWGYYDGAVDGIFGSGTAEAVRYFQRKNGLTADGIVGPATLKALGMSTGGGGSGQESTVELLARVISAEARGEPYSGQVGVVYQPGAFTCMVDGQIDQPVADSAYRAARDALNGADPSGGAIYYFNPSTATSAWIWSRPLIKVIGSHRFCA